MGELFELLPEGDEVNIQESYDLSVNGHVEPGWEALPDIGAIDIDVARVFATEMPASAIQFIRVPLSK